MLMHIMVKLLKAKDKEQISKPGRENNILHRGENYLINIQVSTEIMEVRRKIF